MISISENNLLFFSQCVGAVSMPLPNPYMLLHKTPWAPFSRIDVNPNMDK